ncbi:hypothetical protein L210DRAFT_3570315 [Boletus edulis BED1]|uniref:F-box domain-containing protein n=1 Tax=Boletus edulis BED1 TaxID=1328754 RepID=A0AAD4BE97_BOLED|nr:hypothetical protein L210DRAFT_3570315 [Boletus edulis BED1]
MIEASYMPIHDMALTAQARVDEEIAKQLRSLCDLRTQRNSFSLISRLPTETLAAIFIYSARDYHSTHFTRTVPGWVNVSYVCRHWRNVALNCATLWSYLFLTTPRWTEELLARSKQTSLKLHAEVYRRRRCADDQGLCFVRQVMNHIERIQELHLELPRMRYKDHFLSSPAPRLQNLKISVGSRDGPSEQFSALFDGDTPALRTLELSYCPVPWYSFKLNGLTTLDLRLVPSQLQQNVVEFLATLSSMQDLTHLYLHDAIASTAGFLSSAEFHTFQKINLPRLSRLLLAAPLSTVIAFVACVNIPMKTEVRLDCGFEDGLSLHDYASLFSVLAQRFSTSTSQAQSSPTFRSLIIDLAGCRKELTFSPLERDCDSLDPTLQQDWGCNTPLKIRVCWFKSDTRWDLDCILDDVSSFVPLMDVQSVHVINPPVLPAIWRSALGHLQDLRYLKLSSGNLPDLAPVLSLTALTTSEGTEGQGGHTNRNPGRMLAPTLEKLELHGISFWKRSKKDMDKHPVDLQALCDALTTRKGSSGQLVITHCIQRNMKVMKVRSVPEKFCFNMVGCWKNGRFRVVEQLHEVPAYGEYT